MSSSCDIHQSSQRSSNSLLLQPVTTPSMKIPITQFTSSHLYSNTINNRHFTTFNVSSAAEMTTTTTTSNNGYSNLNVHSNHSLNTISSHHHNNNISPMAGLALSPSSNSDINLHFGSPFQNFYKLVIFFKLFYFVNLKFN